MKFLFFCFFISSISVLSQDLHQYVKVGAIDEVLLIAQSNPEKLNGVSSSGYTPLMLAAYYNKYEVANVLLQQGATVNKSSKYGSALMAAVVKGNEKIVKLLISHKADVNIKDENNNTALLYAVLFNQTEIAAQLLAAGANPHHKDIQGNKALDYAILKQNEQFIKLLSQYL